jgi:hypothetical protein
MTRSGNQNRLYHTYATQLYNSKVVTVYDGRFTEYGYPNPFKFRPSMLSYDSFRDIMKALDFEYDRDDKGRPISSTKVSVDVMNKHITFLEVLLSEIK